MVMALFVMRLASIIRPATITTTTTATMCVAWPERG
jgi:hypothetical protein